MPTLQQNLKKSCIPTLKANAMQTFAFAPIFTINNSTPLTMLEILNNRMRNTHENEQFRRVVNIIEATFEKFGYNGLLIGNPFNESYSRFRADAILYYNNGLILIDFKDYQEIIKLPPNENEFHSTKWYNESQKDRSRLEIKVQVRNLSIHLDNWFLIAMLLEN